MFKNDDLQKQYIKTINKYKNIKQIINKNRSNNNLLQNEINKYLSLNNITDSKTLKIYTNCYKVIKDVFDHYFKNLSKEQLSIRLLYYKINENNKKFNQNILLVIILILSDIIKLNEILGYSVRHHQIVKYIVNRFNNRYNLIIKNKEIFTKENIENYINFMFQVLEYSKFIEIIILKKKERSYKYIKFSGFFMIVLNSIAKKKRSILNFVYIPGKTYQTFLYKKDKTIMFNSEKTQKTEISEDIFHNLEYLNSIPFKINVELLDTYLDNLEFYTDQYIEGDLSKYKNIYDYIESEKNSNDLRVKMSVKRVYKSKLSKAMIFIDAVIQADLCRNNTIYFNTSLDFKGSIIYNGWNLNPQSNKMISNLLQFKDYTEFLKLDVHASRYQILGLILRDEKILKLTNVLKSNEKNNFYDFFLEQINLNNNKNITKDLLMCITYNEGCFSRSKKIVEYYENINQPITFQESYVKALNIENKVFEILPCLNKIKILINEIIDEKKKLITILDHPFLKSYQFYILQEDKNTSFKDLETDKRIKITLKFDKIPLKINKRKNKSSTLPNLISCIDSIITHFVISNLKNSNIPVYTTNDSFIIPKKFEKKFQKVYSGVLLQIFKENFLKAFIENNKIETKTSKEIINDLDSKKNILNQKNISKNILNYEENYNTIKQT